MGLPGDPVETSLMLTDAAAAPVTCRSMHPVTCVEADRANGVVGTAGAGAEALTGHGTAGGACLAVDALARRGTSANPTTAAAIGNN